FRQKKELAVAYAQQKLAHSPDPLATLRDTICECLETDECRIFEHQPEQKKLVAVGPRESGSLAPPRPQAHRQRGLAFVPVKPMAYSLTASEDQGFTAYLSTHPGTCARKQFVMDPDEKGLPD